jgi:hypothetical protein
MLAWTNWLDRNLESLLIERDEPVETLQVVRASDSDPVQIVVTNREGTTTIKLVGRPQKPTQMKQGSCLFVDSPVC